MHRRTRSDFTLAAAKLVVDAWIDYPWPGTEQPYAPGHLNGNQPRREVRYELFPYAEKLRNKIERVGVDEESWWSLLFRKNERN